MVEETIKYILLDIAKTVQALENWKIDANKRLRRLEFTTSNTNKKLINKHDQEL